VTDRVIGACVDLTGQTIGSIYVVQVASIRPLKYLVRCVRCGSSWVAEHIALRQRPQCENARCWKQQEYERRFPPQTTVIAERADNLSLDPTALTVPGPVRL